MTTTHERSPAAPPLPPLKQKPAKASLLGDDSDDDANDSDIENRPLSELIMSKRRRLAAPPQPHPQQQKPAQPPPTSSSPPPLLDISAVQALSLDNEDALVATYASLASRFRTSNKETAHHDDKDGDAGAKNDITDDIDSDFGASSTRNSRVIEPLLPLVVGHVRLAVIAASSSFSSAYSRELPRAALNCLGCLLQCSKLMATAPTALVHEALAVLVRVVMESDDATSVNTAVWCLGSQHLSADVVRAQLKPITTAVVSACQQQQQQQHDDAWVTTESEALSALLSLCRQLPHDMVHTADVWLIPTILLSAYARTSSRNKAEHILGYMVPYMYAHPLSESLVHEFFRVHAMQFADTLQRLNCRDVYVIRLWSHLVALFGRVLVKSDVMKKFLRTMEKCFNSTQKDVRRYAFQAWSRLLYAFSLDGFTEHRVQLLVRPIHNAFDNENKSDVRESAAMTWLKLVYVLRGQLHTFWELVMPALTKILADDSPQVQAIGYTFLDKIRKEASIGATVQQQEFDHRPLLQFDRAAKLRLSVDMRSVLTHGTDLFDILFDLLTSQRERVIHHPDDWLIQFHVTMPRVYSALFRMACAVIKEMRDDGRDADLVQELTVGAVEFLIGLSQSSDRVMTPKSFSPEDGTRFAIVCHFSRSFVSNLGGGGALSAPLGSGDSKHPVWKIILRLVLDAAQGTPSLPMDEVVWKLWNYFPTMRPHMAHSLAEMVKTDYERLSVWACVNASEDSGAEGIAPATVKQAVERLVYPVRLFSAVEALPPTFYEAWKRVYMCAKELDEQASLTDGRERSPNHLLLRVLEPLVNAVSITVSVWSAPVWAEFAPVALFLFSIATLPGRRSLVATAARSILLGGKRASMTPADEVSWNLTPLAKLLALLINKAYDVCQDPASINKCVDLISQFGGLLTKVEPAVFEQELAPFIAHAFERWLVNVREDSDYRPIYTHIESAWTTTMDLLKQMRHHNSEALKKCAGVVCAGVETKWSRVANVTLSAWQTTFGAQRSLAYPDELKVPLQRIKNRAEISLPSWKDIQVSPSDGNVDEQSSQQYVSLSVSQESQAPPRPSALQEMTLGQAFKTIKEYIMPKPEVKQTPVNQQSSSSAAAKLPPPPPEESPLVNHKLVHRKTPRPSSSSTPLTAHQREARREKVVMPMMYTDDDDHYLKKVMAAAYDQEESQQSSQESVEVPTFKAPTITTIQRLKRKAEDTPLRQTSTSAAIGSPSSILKKPNNNSNGSSASRQGTPLSSSKYRRVSFNLPKSTDKKRGGDNGTPSKLAKSQDRRDPESNRSPTACVRSLEALTDETAKILPSLSDDDRRLLQRRLSDFLSQLQK